MSNKLNAFLNPELPEEKEVFISSRFKGEDGKPVLFRIKPLTQEENSRLQKRATRKGTSRNGHTQEFDATLYSKILVVAATVYPDFHDAELCAAYKTNIPEEIPGKMLLAGEFKKLSDEITILSGFDEEAAAEIGEQAKN